MAAIFRRACWQGCPWLASGNLACDEFPILTWKVPDPGKIILSTSGTKHLLPSEILGFWHLPVRECLHDYPLIKALNSKSQMGFLRRDIHMWPCMLTVREGSTPGVVSSWAGRDSIKGLLIDFSNVSFSLHDLLCNIILSL